MASDNLLTEYQSGAKIAPHEPERYEERSHDVSVGQRALWFLQKLNPKSVAYNLARAVRIRDALDVHALSQSFDEMAMRHEALRTTFPAVDGAPVARVWPSPNFRVAFEDLSSLPPETLDARIRAIVETPFDLEKGPLLRVAVFTLGPDDYVMSLAIHHIVSDGWSQDIMLAEFGKIYTGIVNAQPSGLTPVHWQPRNHTAWQQDLLTGPDAARLREYWLEILATPPPPLLLAVPWGEKNPPKRSSANAQRLLPDDLSEGVRSLARTSGRTMYVILLAAFELLLQRMTGSEDFLIATPMAGRDRRSHLAVVGYLANIAILRARIDPSKPILSHIKSVGEAVSGAQRHQHFPYAMLAREAGLIDGAGEGAPVRLSYAHRRGRTRGEADSVAFLVGRGRVKIGPFDAEMLDVDTSEPQFELAMATGEIDNRLAVTLTYDRAFISADVAELMLGRYAKVLQQMIDTPAMLIDDLDILPDQEKALLASFAAKQSFEELTLDRRFNEISAENPAAIAIIDGDSRYSYRELDQRACAIASALLESGVQAQSPVAIMANPGFHLIAAIIGVLKAGAAYVPLDCQFPEERLAFMLQDAKVCHAVVEAGFPVPASYSGLHIDPAVEPVRKLAGRPLIGPTPQSLAYIIYTSGSTGRPKGVEVTHGAVARLLTSTANLFNFNTDDCWTLFHSASFDFSVWEMFGALLHGGRLLIVPQNARRNPAIMHELLRSEAVTVFNQTPSAFAQFALWDRQLPPNERQSLHLRLVIFGGETLNPSMLRSWFEDHEETECKMVNMYGITETTVHVTYHSLGTADLNSSGSPIGTAIPDLGVRIIDRRGRQVPIGAVGELVVSGPGLARGYLGRPELTAERFVKLSTSGAERFYKSGDLARQRPNGLLYYLGRADRQVKIRGFRIELGEIESVIAQQVGITAAVATTLDREDSTKIHAYFVGDDAVSVQDLRTSISKLLPAYMMPASFTRIASVPYTPSGKIDRNSLPHPSLERPEQFRSYVAPRTDVEQALAEIWASVLGLDKVGIHDRFFDIGGDSILSLTIVARARARRIAFDITDVFEYPTIAGLADVATRADAELTPLEVPAPFALIAKADCAEIPDDVEDAYPLSALQAGMLYHSELQPEANVYREIFSLKVRFPLQTDRLEAAITAVVARHGALRTTFDLASFSQPLQLVRLNSVVLFDAHDISGLDTATQQEMLVAYRSDACRERTDLRSQPPIRFVAHRLADSEFQFTVSFHHVILDGWSLANIVSEIFSRYLQSDESVPIDPIPPLFAMYISQEQQAARSRPAVRFWRDNLVSAPFSDLPYEPSGSGSAQRIRTKLGKMLTAKLRDRAIKFGVPLKTLLLAAHCRVLAFVTNEADLVTGLVSNGRPEMEGGERCVGIFLNTLPFRVHVGNLGWVDLVRVVHEQEKMVLRHRHLPLPEIQRLHSGRPLFEHNFTYIHMRVYNERLSDFMNDSTEHPDLYEHTNHALTSIFEIDLSGELALSLRYLDSKISLEQARRYLGYFRRALQDCADAGDASQSLTALLCVDEINELGRMGGYQSGPHRNWSGSLAQLVDAHAVTTPDAVAIKTTISSISYAQLSVMAVQVARALTRVGVGKGARIGIGAERRMETIIAMLGAIKAGAAFVPLHLDEPLGRLESMIAQADVRLVLRLGGGAPVPGIATLDLFTMLADSEAETFIFPAEQSEPDELAYIMFTSGSSGQPKGVCIEHGQMMSYIKSLLDHLDLPTPQRFSATGRLGWDHPYTCILAALASGGTLCLPNDDEMRTPEQLANFMHRHEVDVLKTIPSFFDAVLEIDAPERLLPSRLLLFGGEALGTELVRKVLELRPGLDVRNHYGPTETTIGVTMSPTGLNRHEQPSIGKPFAHVTAVILDEFSRLVPAGAIGELHIGGPSVARGYAGGDEQNSSRFVALELFGKSGRYYRTGDRARWLPDGQLAFLGRFDDQVKIRGIRVEPREVDAASIATGFVKESATLVQTDEEGEARLVNYVVAATDFAATHASLLDELELERVIEWERTHDELYGSLRLNGAAVARANTIGWNSSYSGASFTGPEMEEYLSNYNYLLGANSSLSILEIGCGAGLVLFHLAAAMREYVGVDLSHAATDHVSAVAEKLGYTHVSTFHMAAHDIGSLGSKRFDRIIFASVAQKFPSLRYLQQTLLNAIETAAPSARIILSDIRDLDALPLFHASVQLHRSDGADTARELLARTRRAIEQEAELAIDRRYFLVFGDLSDRVKRVLVRPKRGWIANELTSFRYDVTIELDIADGPDPTNVSSTDAPMELGESLEAQLSQRTAASILLPHKPNRRQSSARLASDLIDNADGTTATVIQRKASHPRAGQIDPNALAELGDRHGYDLAYAWDSQSPQPGDIALQYLRKERRL